MADLVIGARAGVPVVSVGGVNDDPLFAKALLRNARAVSKHPARETVIVVAHGQGNDAGNQRWLGLLDSLTRQMRTDGGGGFRAIRYATWREDWPDKNKAAVQHAPIATPACRLEVRWASRHRRGSGRLGLDRQ